MIKKMIIWGAVSVLVYLWYKRMQKKESEKNKNS